MATITITRSVTDQGALVDVNLVSAFQRNSMEFTVERGVLADTYATVKITRADYGIFEYRAIKTGTVGTTDSYIIDLSTVFTSLVGEFPTVISSVSKLMSAIIISVVVYDVDGGVVKDEELEYIYLCFAYQDISTIGGLNDVAIKGSSRTIYHNGKIGFYNSGTPSSTTLTIAGIAKSYTLGAFYNNISLDATQLINGTLTSSASALSIPLYYKPPYGEHEIAWLNRDGAWSFWNFRQVSSEIKVKKSNEVATYYPTNFQTISKSRMISADKTVEYVFDTLAYNPEHFAQLCEIQESLAVIWNNKLMSVSGCDSLTSVCKQNLRFTLKLEVDENIAGY